jgi:hypothetical protein
VHLKENKNRKSDERRGRKREYIMVGRSLSLFLVQGGKLKVERQQHKRYPKIGIEPACVSHQILFQ